MIEQYEKAKEKVQTLDALIRHCPVHVHMLLQQELPAEEVIRRLSCRLPFIQHDDLRNRCDYRWRSIGITGLILDQ